MERKNNSLRDTLSLLLSVCLHGSAVAVIVLGPSFFPAMVGTETGSGTQNASEATVEMVEFTVADSTAEAQTQVTETAVAAQPTSAPVVSEAPVVKPVPTPAVVAQKPKTVSNKLPEKAVQTEAVQTPVATPVSETTPELVETSDSDVLVAPAPVEQIQSEDIAAETAEVTETTQATETKEVAKEEIVEETPAQEEVPVVAAKVEEKVEDKITPPPLEPVAETQVTETAPVAAEPTPTPVAETTKSAETTSTAAAAATTAATTANSNANTGSSEGSSLIKAKRSYLSLKQMSGNTPPTYTRDMRFQKLEGRGELVCFVNKDGRVTNMRVTKSTGKGELDKAALQAFSKYKFEPNQEGYTSFPFEFTLKGPAVSDTGRLRTTMSR